ncbi:tRNA (adenosine(37)-N6)-dimethylallyltransferase MiaA [Pseudobdellovibrio sp. HCB154]|uniref:tRNA (adenosine(37)-N6)-dimethylallyltransferase MiaA n=1 Tax=Pseudobdellovibrio sp. HCB154 TaxID=3386277 RepID=UPI003917011F
MSEKTKVIFVVGPTASGKSALAMQLAKKFNGSIINIDSVQFYEGLIVGSAAPSEDEKKQVPHYLFSYVKAPHEMTAGQYIRDFYELIESGKVTSPLFVVGGTGFYVQALEKGMYDLPEVSEEIKKEVLADFETFGSEKMFTELKEFDPETELHPNDHYRVGRALEVKRAFNLKMSEFKNSAASENKNKLPYPSMKIGLTFETDDKEKFVQRVHQRTLKMLDEGIIEETKHFLEAGFENWAPLSSVGYHETKAYLQGELKREELAQAITQATMKLVKKQKTWFKRDEAILWSDVFTPDFGVLENKVQDFLRN